MDAKVRPKNGGFHERLLGKFRCEIAARLSIKDKDNICLPRQG
jgi:hypothetical protein